MQVDPCVYKFLKKTPREDGERILLVIDELLFNPFNGDIQKMKGEENSWRRRIGSYRIFYEILSREKIIHLFHAERRASNTY